jgi:hypothetical protein
MSAICGSIGRGDRSIVERMVDSISSGRSVQYFVDDRIIVAGAYQHESDIASSEGDVWVAVAGNLFFQDKNVGGAPALAVACTAIQATLKKLNRKGASRK